MKLTKIIAATLLISAGLMSAPAMAAGPFYGGVSIGQSKFNDACNGVSGAGVRCSDSDTGYKILGGYQINPNVAVEATFADLGQAKASDNFGNFISQKGSGFGVGVVGTLPLANNFSLLGRLGFTRGEIKTSSNVGSVPNVSSTELSFGVGASYAVTPTVEIRGEWEQFKIEDGNIGGKANLLSIGAVMKF
jgi:OmpA-OmpF porin, OOP family